MRSFLVFATLAITAASLPAQDDTLRVLRSNPDDTSSVTSVVTVTFDRPVAGMLDATIAPARIFRIEPAIAGTVTWRDPVTIRFVPDQPLAPGSRYTVTIDSAVRAMDGARMSQPYQFSFRVPGPQLLEQTFASAYERPPTLLPYDGKLLLLYSAPVDLERLSNGLRLDLPGCDAARPLGLHVVRQRPVAPTDPYLITNAGGWQRDTIADRFRRVVELAYDAPLPPDCVGSITIPTTADDSVNGASERYAVRTAPPFRLDPLECSKDGSCRDGQMFLLRFTATASAEDVKRHVHIEPGIPFEMRATGENTQWWISAKLAPHTVYAVVVDSTLRAVDGRLVTPPYSVPLITSDVQSAVAYSHGAVVAGRNDAHSIPLRHVNVRSVRVITAIVPQLQRARAISLGAGDTGSLLATTEADTTLVDVGGRLNVDTITELPLHTRRDLRRGELLLVRVEVAQQLSAPLTDANAPRDAKTSSPNRGATPALTGVVIGVIGSYRFAPAALVEFSDLQIHARMGMSVASVLVASRADGSPRPCATVRYLLADGSVASESRTDSGGVAVLRYSRSPSAQRPNRRPLEAPSAPVPVAIEAIDGDDRLIIPVQSHHMWSYGWGDPLSPARLGAWGEESPPMAATIFAERGIYRPGEMMYLTGVLRAGTLDALTVPGGAPVRLTLTYHANEWDSDEDVVVHDTVLTASAFGTVVDSLRLRTAIPLGRYEAELQTGGAGAWVPVANEIVRVAEYRAPEFLVDAVSDTATLYAGDTARARIAARYLFGAPMGNGAVTWRAELHALRPWEIRIPGADGWTVGEWDWLSATSDTTPEARMGEGTLDARGRTVLQLPVAALRPSRPGRIEFSVAVTDVNRQVVTTSANVAVHPARVYVLAQKERGAWFWTVGKPATVRLRTVRPDGVEAPGTPVIVTVVRREWLAERGGSRWTDTTVRIDTVRTGAHPLAYTFTPERSGVYELRLSASDGRGGTALTSVSGWVIDDAPQRDVPAGYRLTLVASQREAVVGDVVDVAFESPFDAATAWLTVEREGVIDRQRLTVRRGSNVVPVRIARGHVPNVFVSVMLLPMLSESARRPDAPTALLRVGYTEITVSAAPKRLTMSLAPKARVYQPGDTAVVSARVTDVAGRGARSEITLWAVDEGVLALTGYTTPDLLARIFRPRGVGSFLASSTPFAMIANPDFVGLQVEAQLRGASMLSEVVATQSAFGEPPVRANFRSAAFYLAGATTDDSGRAVLRGRVPDNLTTYRVMAIAVGTGDEFGSADTTLLVTRPLVARPSLPRFVRASDTLLAGAVVNARDGRARQVTVDVAGTGIGVRGERRLVVRLAAGKGAEARFGFAVPSRDSVRDTVMIGLRASDGTNADAVETRLPVKPDFHPRVHTIIGAVRGREDVVFDLPGDIDPARSRLSLRLGTSPLISMLAAYERLRAYPYDCTEQLSSNGHALIALWRATGSRARDLLGGDPRARVQDLADALSRRQRHDGAIRYWDDDDWSSPWLSAYAGLFLLEARAQGISVDSGVLRRLSTYLAANSKSPVDTNAMNRYERRDRRRALGERVAVVDYLRRAGTPDVSSENALIAAAASLSWEDRLRLAELLSQRPDAVARARAMVDDAWRAVTRAGRRVDLPDSSYSWREFPSRVAPAARLLTATFALRPEHPLIGGLVETVLQQGRAESGWAWNTQDYASAVTAMAALAPALGEETTLTVTSAGRTLLSVTAGGDDSVRSVALDGLLSRTPNGRSRLSLSLGASTRLTQVYYAASVEEMPSHAPVTPDIQGIVVERWYERFTDGAPVTTVREGDLVRVRLRITVPASRQFVAVEDPLPAGLEPIDLALNTSGTLGPFAAQPRVRERADDDQNRGYSWLYGRWEGGWWSPWEHRELRDDKVVYFARMLWPGSYSASYVARATTAGTFVRPPAHAEEMYNPGLQGRSDGGRFGVTTNAP